MGRIPSHWTLRPRHPLKIFSINNIKGRWSSFTTVPGKIAAITFITSHDCLNSLGSRFCGQADFSQGHPSAKQHVRRTDRTVTPLIAFVELSDFQTAPLELSEFINPLIPPNP